MKREARTGVMYSDFLVPVIILAAAFSAICRQVNEYWGRPKDIDWNSSVDVTKAWITFSISQKGRIGLSFGNSSQLILPLFFKEIDDVAFIMIRLWNSEGNLYILVPSTAVYRTVCLRFVLAICVVPEKSVWLQVRFRRCFRVPVCPSKLQCACAVE